LHPVDPKFESIWFSLYSDDLISKFVYNMLLTKFDLYRYTTVSNALSLNINIMLRNMVNVIGVLCFMFALSWPLTVVTLASLPPTLIVSKVYGRYFKKISKKTQKALAEATEVAEESLGSVGGLYTSS
jgi:ABC-type multidrug transport system fused ATPase/permease subunit